MISLLLVTLEAEGAEPYIALATELVASSRDPAIRAELGHEAAALVPLLKKLGASHSGNTCAVGLVL